MFMSSLDPSLTTHSLLAALDTVGNAKDMDGTGYLVGDLERVLQIPFPKREEMRSQHSAEVDYRYHLIEYYLKSHECAGWNHLAGRLLYEEQHNALERVKMNVTADKGRCVV